jgi:hypothetical protein
VVYHIAGCGSGVDFLLALETAKLSLLYLLIALLLTIILEFFVYLILIQKGPLDLMLFSLLINSFTNPILNYLYNYAFHNLYFLEAIVVLVEGYLLASLAEIGYVKALQVSLAANTLSLAVGLIISL